MIGARVGAGMIGRMYRFEAVRYLLNGALVAAVNNVLLIVGARAAIGRLDLVIGTWIVGGSLGYWLHARTTFSARLDPCAYVRFMAGVALGIPVVWVLLEILAGWLALPMAIAAPLMTAIMLVYNYCNARFAIVRQVWHPGWRRSSRSGAQTG